MNPSSMNAQISFSPTFQVAYLPEMGNPLVVVKAEYKVWENNWYPAHSRLEFTAPHAPENFVGMDEYVNGLAVLCGLSSIGSVSYQKEQYAYRGVRSKGLKHMGLMYLHGSDGSPYVRFTLSIDKRPLGGYATSKMDSNSSHSVGTIAGLIESLKITAETTRHNKPMPNAMGVIQGLAVHNN